LLLLSLLPLCGWGQFFDDFSDGDFTTNPTWSGDDSLFRVNPGFELQLNDTNASSNNSTFLYTESKAINKASWEFKFSLAFDPSTSNYARFYIVSDQKNLLGSLNGYYVKIGGKTGTVDDISLYKQSGGSSSLVIDGRDGTAGKSPSGWIKVTRDSVGNWELFSDTSMSHSGYVLEGTANNSDYTTSSVSGVFCKYTSGRKYGFTFDSIRVTGTNYSDTTKPYILNYQVLDSHRIQIQFSEKVDPVMARDTTNYEVLDRLGKFYRDTSAEYVGTDSSLILLSIKNKLGQDPLHFLNIDGIKDLFGNTMNRATFRFYWPSSSNADKGDILINEIMADPSPPIALPIEEFVELLNNSAKTYDLKDWTFSDPSKSATLPSYQMAPGDDIIICSISDTGLFSPYGKVLGLVDFPSLNNSGDILTLNDSSGSIIDEVEYSDSWYGDPDKTDGGFSLERINPNHPCSGSSNWSGSESLDGGTPGKQNSIFSNAPETNKPEVLSVRISGPNLLTVEFSKPVDSASLVAGTFTVTGGLSITGNVVLVHPSSFVDLVLSAPPAPGVLYHLKIANVADCFGNAIKDNNTPFGIGSNPNPLDVIISEIFPNPDDSKTTVSSYEYVEIFNRSTRLISLDSCYFTDKGSRESLQGGLLVPNGRLVICEKNGVSELSKYGSVLGLSTWPSLNNSGDLISIINHKDEAIHLVEYSDSWYQDDSKKVGGWSLEIIDPENPCGDQQNWRASIDQKGGTPNAENSIKTLNPASNGPNLIRASAVGDSSVQLSFDQIVTFSDLNVVTFKFSHGINSIKITRDGSNNLIVNLDKKLVQKVIYSVEVNGLTNCSGLLIENNKGQFGLSEASELSDVIINEIMFDPYPSAKSDYVEIYNRSQKIISLQNWLLCEFDINKDTLDGCQLISSEPFTLLPGEFALLNKDNTDIIKHYPTRDENRFIQLNSLPTLSNDEGIAVLVNDSSVEVDRLNYSSDWHHVLIKNPDGISLERLDYNRETQNRGNWHSAAKSVSYGTPGLPNSQYYPATDFSENIVIEPETFSPDNDGFEDILNINYSFENSGNVANVTIYDVEGRQMIQLVNNELLATTGTITWDGRTDNNLKAKAGIYIISFEIHDQNGKVSHFKKTCVLAIKF